MVTSKDTDYKRRWDSGTVDLSRISNSVCSENSDVSNITVFRTDAVRNATHVTHVVDTTCAK